MSKVWRYTRRNFLFTMQELSPWSLRGPVLLCANVKEAPVNHDEVTLELARIERAALANVRARIAAGQLGEAFLPGAAERQPTRTTEAPCSR